LRATILDSRGRESRTKHREQGGKDKRRAEEERESMSVSRSNARVIIGQIAMRTDEL